MKKIAILGFGVVGSGIARVLEQNAERIAGAVGEPVGIKYICDLREFPDSPYGDRIVHSLDPIVADPEVEAVCEAMGGSHPAYEYSVRCLEAGKHVISSNKEVVSRFGDRLLARAREHGVSYLFEASVGGGIPLIRPFSTSLACDRMTSVTGIVNGTTNYILTKMKDEGVSFGDALAEAQRLGYAERDPSADIDGIDAKRKIMILTALMTGLLPEDGEVCVRTVRDLTTEDISAAGRLGGEVKLIARSEVLSEPGEAIRYSAFVTPMIVLRSNPLSHVADVYNAVSLTSPVTGDILYYGRGAGSLPTAGAMLSDVTAALSGAAAAETAPVFERRAGAGIPFDSRVLDFYVRFSGSGSDAAEKLAAAAECVDPVTGSPEGVCEFLVRSVSDRALGEALPDAVRIPILR